jgi:hypothetical protein
MSCGERGNILQRPLQDHVFGPASVFFQRQIYKKNKQNASFFPAFLLRNNKKHGI